MKVASTSIAFAAVLAVGSALQAAPLFSDDFDVDSSANWSFNSSVTGDTRSNNVNNEADFFFDYSIAGIPSAPRSTGGTTRGIKLEANVNGTAAGGVFSGASVSPIGQKFFGNFKLSFDAWGNFQGPMPGGGNGTTELYGGGVGRTDTTAQFPGGTVAGAMFATTLDGGSATDYRAYLAGGAPLAETSGVYAAGNVAGVTNNTNVYYSTFTGAIPAAQTTYASSLGFASQTGSPAVGAQSFAWRLWDIERVGNTMTWSIDSKLIATIDVTGKVLDGDNIFLNMFDSNTGASNQAIARSLLFSVFDNVVVTPEPTSLSALALGGLLMARRRK